MPRTHQLPPSAASLSASMRDLGYSLESAVADIIDNSIAAYASTIKIYCVLVEAEPYLAILDNGSGMTNRQLINAMKHGSISPAVKRDADDLGRFGLGLKTASFSQCKQLTVITCKEGVRSAAQWDLQLVDEKDDWLINILDDEESGQFNHIDELGDEGTLVVWKNLDRLFEDESGSIREQIVYQKLDILERHLSLVFHRYLSGDYKAASKVKIYLNNHKIEPFDPFCRTNKATQVLPEEKVWVDGAEVKIQPYILPHHSKLTATEYDFYLDRSDFISNQGAYIYRNGRLMAWGDWFRLIPKGEATKLARVQIDFPNSMDESWTIDIKKSRARPPRPVRERVKQIINQITSRSTSVHKKRGQKLFTEVEMPMWERYADKGAVRYDINRGHPLLDALLNKLEEEDRQAFRSCLNAITSSLPMEMIYADFSAAPKSVESNPSDETDIKEQLHAIKTTIFNSAPMDAGEFKKLIDSTRLFEGREKEVDDYIKGEFQ